MIDSEWNTREKDRAKLERVGEVNVTEDCEQESCVSACGLVRHLKIMHLLSCKVCVRKKNSRVHTHAILLIVIMFLKAREMA